MCRSCALCIGDWRCVLCSSCLVSQLGWMLFFFKQKTAYELRISDWSSDVCSSDLAIQHRCLTDHLQERLSAFILGESFSRSHEARYQSDRKSTRLNSSH